MLGVKELAEARGFTAHLAYADRMAGDALELALDDRERDGLVELLATRRPRGRAQLAVIATTATAIAVARDRLARAHVEISRLANARRKFVHRYVRLIDELATSWAERAAAAPTEALATLQGVLPDAVPALGIGHHVELAADDDQRTKHKYPTVHAAAVLVDGAWRCLPYDPRRKGWAPRPALFTALVRSRPGLEPARAGIVVDDEVASAIEPGAALAAGVGAAIVADQVAQRRKDAWWADCVDPCDLLDLCDVASFVGDLGNCVPDCNFDFDCGAIDCSW